MQHESLRHEMAWETALHIVELFAPYLREEEKREAFVEVYARVKAGLECYEVQAARREARLRPSTN